jgi:hypothetical protein
MSIFSGLAAWLKTNPIVSEYGIVLANDCAKFA